MKNLVFKVTERITKETINGPLTTVIMIPDAAFETSTGYVTLMLFDDEDLEKFQVGNKIIYDQRK